MGVSRRSWAGVGLLAAVLVAACGAPVPPALTAPPAPADPPTWPSLTWTATTMVAEDGFPNERITGVSAIGRTVVAVGVAEGAGVQVGRIWVSLDDGREWVPAPDRALVDVAFVDVVAGPGGFVAFGDRIRDPRAAGGPTPVAVHSPDGTGWVPLELPPLDGGYATAIAASADGYAALATIDGATGSRLLLSDDGLAWRLIVPPADGPMPGGEAIVGAPGGGWLVSGRSPAGALAVGWSRDGRDWPITELEPADTKGQAVTSLVVGPSGLLAQGIASDGCSPLASCAGSWVTWWSATGDAWGRLPTDAGLTGVVLAAHPERGFLAVTAANVQASPDGWAWTTIGAPGDEQLGLDDGVVVGDRIIGGGSRWSLDGASESAGILVGAPD